MSQWHGGKGDKPRKVDPDKYGAGWDRIFNQPKRGFNEPLDSGDAFWYHTCKNNGPIHTMKGQSCNWCGIKEDGTLD